MSRAWFSKQKQYYVAKIFRERQAQSNIQEILNSEQAKQSNKQRQYNWQKQAANYFANKSLLNSGSYGDLFGVNGNSDLMNDYYNALGTQNDWEDQYDDMAMSDMKISDLEQQLEAIKSQIQADQQELKSLNEGEKTAIEQGASKY